MFKHLTIVLATLLGCAGLVLVTAPKEAKADVSCFTGTGAQWTAAAQLYFYPLCNSSGQLVTANSSGGSTSSPGYTRIQDGTSTALAAVSSVNTGGTTIASLGSTLLYTQGLANVLTPNSTSIIPVGGLYNSDAQTTAGVGMLTVPLNMGYNNTGFDRLRTMTAITGSGTGVLAVGQEPQTPTYTASVAGGSGISNAGTGVWFEITGAASHVIRIRQCTISGDATTGTFQNIQARVQSSADSGGTTGTAPIVGPLSSASAATAATAVTYTTSPTAGANQTVAASQLFLLVNATAGTTQPQQVVFSWPNTSNSQPPTLNSASQQFTLFNTVAVTGGTYYASCQFTDTAT